LDKPSAYIQELGLQDKIVLLYSGNMGKKQGLDIVIKIAKKIQNRKDIVFVMCGNGVELENLKELGKECQNIIWLDLQPLEKLNQLLNLADIHLLPQQKGIADLVMPSKLTGMLSSGKPTIAIASESSQVGIVLETCGVVVDYDCEADFETAIRELADDREKRIELGKKAYEYACNNLKYSQIMQEFENNLKKLI
jgi:colanic acid biosynthesis glycosyl transferase WcaI